MYYFFNRLESKDNIRVIPFLITDSPTEVQLNKCEYCIDLTIFEDKVGYEKVIYVNFIDKKLEVEYVLNRIEYLENENLNTVKYTLDLDFRVTDIEFSINDSVSVSKLRSVYNMRSQYDMMKMIILSGDFDESDMIYKINTYHDRFKKISTEQRDELLALIEAGRIVGKE